MLFNDVICGFINTVAYQDTFLKLITTIGLILLIGMSCYVYTKVKESGKQPRPEFIDVPYMRRITKVPFFFIYEFIFFQ